MKVDRAWLQNFFEAPLPGVSELADTLTFHAFEIDAIEGEMLDVKVLPNRSSDCLSHRGVAREIAAIINLSLKADPLRAEIPKFPQTAELTVSVEDPKKCGRYSAALVRGVKVGPSPEWLKAALESVGQRSINNVVDATNYVMLNIGQPLHAFDAAKVGKKGDAYHLGVRSAREGEKLTTLTGDEYTLNPNISVIVDGVDTALALAGVKGGKAAEVTNNTTDLLIEAANFDGTTTRRAAQTLKLFTDASQRFQNRPSSELVGYGMRDVLALITEVAGGELVGVADAYPSPAASGEVRVSHTRINALLGSHYTAEQVEDVFTRLDLPFTKTGEEYVVTPPFERTDLMIAEDLCEEVGRIIGYDKLDATPLPPATTAPDQSRFCGIERMKDQLIEQGFSEVSARAFSKKGDIELLNPLDVSAPKLRTSLEEGLTAALAQAKHVAPLVLAPKQKPKLFEVGTVFPKEGEYLELRMTESVPEWGENFPPHDNLSKAKLEEYGKDYSPKRYELDAFVPYSSYPFIVRDVALWAGGEAAGAEQSEAHIQDIIRENAGALMVRLDLFDQFEKDGRISFAYRLVFQSFERTLTDDEVNTVMERVYGALKTAGFEVR